MVTTKTLTVSKTEIDPAFKDARAEDCALSILYQQDGLSFLVKHRKNKLTLLFGFLPRADWDESPIESLLDSFSELPGEVHYAIEVPNSVLVPGMMSEGLVPNWTAKLLGDAANFMDLNDPLNIKFYGRLSLEDHRLSRSERVVRNHNWAIQMERLTPTVEAKLWVHLYNEEVFIMASKGAAWHVVNSFPCANNEELLYHCGNVSEQLGWERKSLEIEMSGRSARTYKTLLEPYFGKVLLFDASPWLKISSAMKNFDPVEFATLVRI